MLFAFLRAINVGGRVVKMAALKKVFESLGYRNVETYIASGNVIFQASGQRPQAAEKKITAALLEKFKYDHTAFVRTHAEVHAIAAYAPFTKAELAKGKPPYVGFIAAEPDAARKQAIAALCSDIDEFRAHGREVYWLSRTGMGESRITKAMFERAMGGPITWRSVNTVRALAEKYPLA
jgi:uncharacterized protein (DUF1697 family)